MRFPDVTERKVLVTGCSSGIGRAAAHALRAAGWRVWPTARGEEDLARLRAGGFEPVGLDLADAASTRRAAAEALERMDGTPGAIVNNAGYGQPGAIEDLPREAMRRQFEVNLFGLQELTNAFIPRFRALGRGRIVNVSSVLGRLSLPSLGIYSASKFALEAVSDALRVELRGSGVAVSLVEPGPIATAFGDNARAAAARSLDTARSPFAAAYRAQAGRLGSRNERHDPFRLPPESVAARILHAVASRRPRRRYTVTVTAAAGALMARCLPAAVLDALLARRLRGAADGTD